MTLGLEIEEAGPAPEVVLEATWGWYWAADVIRQAGGNVHLAHPLGIKGFENRRVKTDRIDARLLADLLRMGMLPESWIAPEDVRYQRELVRYRRKLSQLRAGLKAQVHAVLGKEGCVLRSPTCGVLVAGLHVGELDLRGQDVGGIAVHAAARIMALARPGEVLVSSTVRDLVAGSTFSFTERGEHELKGISGYWPLFRAEAN